MTEIYESEANLKDLKIVKGARHCRIVDEQGEIVFRTTNLRDAEAYLTLVEENRRLHHLLDSRGIAPHRIYTLDSGEDDDEVVIVAKAGADSVVVRHLTDGREEIVDLDEVKGIPEANYFIGSEKPVEAVNVAVRVDVENESAMLVVHRSPDALRATRENWRRASFESDRSAESPVDWSDNGVLVFYDEVLIDED